MAGAASPHKSWATLVTNPGYVPGVLTLHRTLVAVSAYPLLVLATQCLPAVSRRAIREAGIDIVDIPHLSPAAGQHPGFDETFLRLNDAWTKLRVFGLVNYRRLVLIDSDMIFLRSMDELFDMELPSDWIAAVPACVCNPFKIAHYPPDWIPENCLYSSQSRYSALTDPAIPALTAPRTSHLLNSGLVVLQPSEDVMQALIEFLNTSPSVAASSFADQDVLAEAFKGRWLPLPWYCNALKTLRSVHQNLWLDTEVRLIHYILDKPWTRRPGRNALPTPLSASSSTNADVVGLPTKLVRLVQDSPHQQNVTDYDAVHAWWWVVWDEVATKLRRGSDVEKWLSLEACVDQQNRSEDRGAGPTK